MFILKTGHQPGVYVPLRALFLVVAALRLDRIEYGFIHIFCNYLGLEKSCLDAVKINSSYVKVQCLKLTRTKVHCLGS